MLGAINSEPTVMEIVAVPVSVALIALTVKRVEDNACVGVPAILPFEVLNVNPEGRLGEIDQLLAVPPVFVAVTAVIALFTVADNVETLKVILGARSTSLIVTVLVEDAVFAFPELSRTVPAPTLKVRSPVVAEDEESNTVYVDEFVADALPLDQPVLVPPKVKSAEVNPVTGSEKVIVTVKLSVLATVVREVIETVGAVVSTVSVVNC
jgi:hypothetical protein